MTDTPRWDLAAAESAVASLDLAREVGAAVGDHVELAEGFQKSIAMPG